MPAKSGVVKAVFLMLCISLVAFQSGCGNSGGKGDAPASNGNTTRLSMATTTGLMAIVADGRSTIPVRLQVTNGAGVGLANVPVTFATTAGALSASPVVRVARAVLDAEHVATTRAVGDDSLTMSTDATGVAQVLLTSSPVVNTAVVTADALGFRTNIVVDFVPGPPARVQIDASPASVNAGGSSTVTATVTDATGNAVPGATVNLTFSTNTSSATLSAASGVTDAQGQVSVKYTAGITVGADTLRAVVTSTSVSGSTSITVTAPSGGGTTSLITSVGVANGAGGLDYRQWGERRPHYGDYSGVVWPPGWHSGALLHYGR